MLLNNNLGIYFLSLKNKGLNFSHSNAGVGELKNIDTNPTFPAFGVGTGTLTLLNGVSQGTTATTRLGRRITLKSLYLRGFVGMGATSTGYAPIRCIIVYDKQANGAAPAATDVLLTNTLSSPNNLSNSRRFVTLVDYIIPNGIGTSGPQGQQIQVYKKLNHPVEFNNGSAGTVADIQTGSVYALFYLSTTLAVASAVSDITCRIRFADN